MTRAEVLANRRKWIDFLKARSKKTIGSLDVGGGERCCLGHGCYALKVRRVLKNGEYSYGEAERQDVAPIEFMQVVGLWNQHGSVADQGARFSQPSLVQLNDDDNWSPKEIAKYLEENINGGLKTPFMPLENFDE